MDIIEDYDQGLRDCISRCALKTREELIEYGYSNGYMAGNNNGRSNGYMEGYNNGYRAGGSGNRIDTLRLRVATAAMQGLLAGGYLAEHSDTAAEAVRQADALLAKLKGGEP